MPLRVALAWLLATGLWSSTFLFIKAGLRDIPPFTFAWLRLAIAVVVLGAIAATTVSWRAVSRRALADIAAAGVLLLGVNYALVFWGAQFVPSGLVAILQAGTPVIALVFGWLLGSERVTARKAIGLVTGFAGVIIIFGAEARASNDAALAGAAAVFAGSICVALAYVWMKTRGHGVPPSAVATRAPSPATCVLVSVAGALTDRNQPPGTPRLERGLPLALRWDRDVSTDRRACESLAPPFHGSPRGHQPCRVHKRAHR